MVDTLDAQLDMFVAADELQVTPCGKELLEQACQKWHYTGYAGSSDIRYAVWWGGRLDGAISFNHRLSLPPLQKRYDAAFRYSNAELARVALRPQDERPYPTSAAVARALRLVRHAHGGIEIVFSYADGNEGHLGGLYRALSWVELGESAPKPYYTDPNGRRVHHMIVMDRVTGGVGKSMVGYEALAAEQGYVRVEKTQPKYRFAHGMTRRARKHLLKLQRDLALNPPGSRRLIPLNWERPKYNNTIESNAMGEDAEVQIVLDVGRQGSETVSTAVDKTISLAEAQARATVAEEERGTHRD